MGKSAGKINWPIVESQKQAADLLGWPVERVKQCKKAGCGAFRHSRIYLGELVSWVGRKGLDDANIDWSRQLKKEQALTVRTKRLAFQGELIPYAEVKRDAAKIQNTLFSELERVFLNEQPAAGKGLDEHGLREVNQPHIEKLRETLRAMFGAIGADATAAQTQVKELETTCEINEYDEQPETPKGKPRKGKR